MRTVYISGPMTGLPEFNYPAFELAQRKLEAQGIAVLSPHEIGQQEGWEWIDYILPCIGMVFAADELALLPGWEQSKGARIEREIALRRGIPVRPIEDYIGK